MITCMVKFLDTCDSLFPVLFHFHNRLRDPVPKSRLFLNSIILHLDPCSLFHSVCLFLCAQACADNFIFTMHVSSMLLFLLPFTFSLLYARLPSSVLHSSVSFGPDTVDVYIPRASESHELC
ncbi:uncharacterized protein DEA37_0002929 [Paragonimus westermani]|uniref:Uncharacterized protein n=1 Tax=Paragonimus westermani TaxID=34504 RepID=A0A5J4NIA7_9TREM|nr:uncharacterized protein DEA37_0002929 [Paragonimus westermani]